MSRAPVRESAAARFFRLRVKDAMGAPWTLVQAADSCRSLVRLLGGRGRACVVVAGARQGIVGTLDRGDLLRHLGAGGSLDLPVERVMRAPLASVREGDLLCHAIALMRRIGTSRLPVLDGRGRLVGGLTLDGALGASVSQLLELADRLGPGETPESLRGAKRAQSHMARTLLEEGLAAPEVQALLGEINRDLYARTVEVELDRLADEGWGEPPVDFDVVVMGSGGRDESFLAPDQDNGFVLASYADDLHAPIDTFFVELASRLTRSLDRIGLPLCRGHVMATNPLWRKHLGQWKAQLGCWLARPSSATLRFADIFFDFSPVYGDAELSRNLRGYLTANVARQHAFLRAMQEVQQDHGVALRPLGGLSTERRRGMRGEWVNLKYHGLLPLVEAVRLLALREGVAPSSTLARLGELDRRGVLSAAELGRLSEAFGQLTGLLLRAQIEDIEAGRPAGNYIALDTLAALEKDRLADALKAIAELRARLRTELTGAI